MEYVISPVAQAYIPVEESDKVFPIRRAYCVGRNYAAHAIEMGHDPTRESPFFFQKNPDNFVIDGADFPYPSESTDVHHEIELLVALKDGGEDLSLAQAEECIFGYAVCLDMTRRDLQGEQKKLGRPWEIGKAFEKSAPCSAIKTVENSGSIESGEIYLEVNGARKQTGDLNQLIWKVPEIISYLSQYFTLSAGDVILTGTPAGVGPVKRGDKLHGFIDGVGTLDCKVV